MQRFLRWLDRATLLTMDYRSHCPTCGVTIAAGTRRDLDRLVYEHDSLHLDLGLTSSTQRAPVDPKRSH